MRVIDASGVLVGVIAATSRVNRTRLPFAEMSNFSLILAPLKISRSLSPWPSTMSLPSPGFH